MNTYLLSYIYIHIYLEFFGLKTNRIYSLEVIKNTSRENEESNKLYCFSRAKSKLKRKETEEPRKNLK